MVHGPGREGWSLRQRETQPTHEIGYQRKFFPFLWNTNNALAAIGWKQYVCRSVHKAETLRHNWKSEHNTDTQAPGGWACWASGKNAKKRWAKSGRNSATQNPKKIYHILIKRKKIVPNLKKSHGTVRKMSIFNKKKRQKNTKNGQKMSPIQPSTPHLPPTLPHCHPTPHPPTVTAHLPPTPPQQSTPPAVTPHLPSHSTSIYPHSTPHHFMPYVAAHVHFKGNIPHRSRYSSLFPGSSWIIWVHRCRASSGDAAAQAATRSSDAWA